MQKYKIHFAPLQGYTEDAYRRWHRDIFGGVDTYYTPFVRMEHGDIRSKDLRDIRPDFNVGVNVVPQVIAADGKELASIVQRMVPFGYTRIDINMGCPFPLQTRHGKGAGLFAHPDKVREVMDEVSAHTGVMFSIKMRLGLDAPDQWKEVMPIINDTPLQHITIHPRIATQQYKGELHMAAFEEMLAACKHPVIFNGNIQSVGDIEHLASEYGNRLAGVMIGRGLLARPSLAQEYANGTCMSDKELIAKIKVMHEHLHEHFFSIIPGEAQQLSKLRTFWDYMEPTIGRKAWKKITKAGNAKNYFAAISDL